jgi:hypothetical protein
MAEKDEFDGRPAPLEGCYCDVCVWVRHRAGIHTKPSDPSWEKVCIAAQSVSRNRR